jgi:hypothetical protein
MGWIETIDSLVANHLTLVVSVGVPILTVLITLLVSYLTITANTKAQSRQRKLEHQLKLADFRQAWIDDMRKDLALYTARTWSSSLNEGVEAEKERVMVQARILMRMNPNDPDYDALVKSILNPVADPEADRKALYQIGQGILKREWERLKADVNAVDGK